MPLLKKHYVAHRDLLRDARPASVRIKDFWSQTSSLVMVSIVAVVLINLMPELAKGSDFFLVFYVMYARWVLNAKIELPFKMPKSAAPLPDPHNPKPGKAGAGTSEGILYLGNLDEADNPDHGRELWLTNSDARTHILFLGTTGSGKTEGLKSLVANALTWGSGFVYIDGKADTDLWASLYALARRFGRDDDLLILNYMTANSDNGAVSNTMNPFSNGSASYLTNMVVNLMPDAGGDNAMWKERAVALMGALMPALTWKRDKGGLLLDVSILRDYIELPAIIKLSRDPELPERIVRALQGYLRTLPGYIDAAFDDEGNERPPTADQPMYDLQVARQQHGYLSMQFTRSLQSLADDYGYIFKAQLADVDVLDIVLNRRILVGLIPSLEKSGDEAANLGKIVVACLKGMMGATLGNTVEGSWENAIGSKQTRSQSSFMTVFDEVGYYTAQGMAVMAAQARSLGFSLIFAAQDLPSMEKRVKQEAQSILANCNLKIFGKLEDPGDTKKFFSDHVGDGFVLESNGMQAKTDTVSGMFLNKPFYDNMGTGGPTLRVRAAYDHLRGQREGEVHMLFAEFIARARMFYAVADRVGALRVQKLLPVPPTTPMTIKKERAITEVAARLNDPDWSATDIAPAATTPAEIARLAKVMAAATEAGQTPAQAAMAAVGGLPEVVTEPPRLFDEPKGTSKTTGSTGASASGASSRPSQAVAASWTTPSSSPQTSASSGAGKPATVSMPAGQQASSGDTEAQSLAAHESLAEPSRGSYMPSDLDTSIVPPIDIEVDGEGIVKTSLPADMAAALEMAAGKLNKGLGGETTQA
ncbi:MAG: type IV secretion system DNA-binding domain-containing protein [Alphaproteobacteria bacterium]|nr:type IV secretion system DNA-binding domain-containing protein [Alphaproteobacteria bacterium]